MTELITGFSRRCVLKLRKTWNDMRLLERCWKKKDLSLKCSQKRFFCYLSIFMCLFDCIKTNYNWSSTLNCKFLTFFACQGDFSHRKCCQSLSKHAVSYCLSCLLGAFDSSLSSSYCYTSIFKWKINFLLYEFKKSFKNTQKCSLQFELYQIIQLMTTTWSKILKKISCQKLPNLTNAETRYT